MDDRTMTMTELATWLRVNSKTIQRWIHRGMPVLNVGSERRPDWRFVWAEVRAWIDDGKPERPSPRSDPHDAPGDG